MPTLTKNDEPEAVSLSAREKRELSQVSQSVRLTLKRLEQNGVSPLAVFDGDAIDSIKDLYYLVNKEDPSNAMPLRRELGKQKIISRCILPLIASINGDKCAEENRKRWSVALYHTFRVLSLFSMPIPITNVVLKPGSVLENQILDIRADLVHCPNALGAIVALLQYYIERKAEKQARFAPAEESKIEDARIDNILRFFRNILLPPRSDPELELTRKDKGIHLGLLGVLFDADLFSTLTIMFCSAAEARGQYTDVVYIIAEIYRNTYRLSSPQEVSRIRPREKGTSDVELAQAEAKETVDPKNPAKSKSVFDLPPPSVPSEKLPSTTVIGRRGESALKGKRGASLREAMKRERSLLGGSRAVTTSARWTSHHSGGFATVKITPATQGSGQTLELPQHNRAERATTAQSANSRLQGALTTNLGLKRIIPARNAVSACKNSTAEATFRVGMQLNSEILCSLSLKARKTIISKKTSLNRQIRADLQNHGRTALPAITLELIENSFRFLAPEIRTRIEEARVHAGELDNEDAMQAKRSFLSLVAFVVGFQREFKSKEFRSAHREARRGFAINKGCMESFLASEVYPIDANWVPVEAGIELDSFKVAFDFLIDSSNGGKDGAKDVELATSAIREMMKMIQSMTLQPEQKNDANHQGEDESEDKMQRKVKMTGREIALNTLEELFEKEDYLNAPCVLAKDFDPRTYSFKHLANIVEIAHSFTSTLLGERELGHIMVERKRKRSLKKKADKAKGDEPEEGVPKEEGQQNSSAVENSNSSTENATVKLVSETPSASELNSGSHKDKSIQSDHVVHNDDASHKKPAREPAAEEASSKVVPTRQDDGENENIVTQSDSEEEILMHEVESAGVVRRFAQARALQVLALPLRACLSVAADFSGALYPVPDRADDILSCAIAAKSLAVLVAVWNTSNTRDKGALQGQFFTFSMLQLLSVCMNSLSQRDASPTSILGKSSEFGEKVTRAFFEWLKINPGLTIDCFLSMDKTTCSSYAHTLYAQRYLSNMDNTKGADDESADSGGEDHVQRLIEESGAHASRLRQDSESSDTDLDTTTLQAVSPRPKNSVAAQMKQKRQRTRLQRAKIAEDDDVDDIDALNIGQESNVDEIGKESGLGSDCDNDLPSDGGEEQPMPCLRSSGKKRKRLSRLPDNIDLDERREAAREQRRRRKERKTLADINLEKEAKKRDAKRRQPSAGSKKAKKKGVEDAPSHSFSSSDEYDEALLRLVDSSGSRLILKNGELAQDEIKGVNSEEQDLSANAKMQIAESKEHLELSSSDEDIFKSEGETPDKSMPASNDQSNRNVHNASSIEEKVLQVRKVILSSDDDE